MDNWQITEFSEFPKLNDPVFIEGLPGIGNIGKISVDFIIQELKAKKMISFFSYSLPNTVFVNEKNLVDLPDISLYHLKVKKVDLLILAGDIQPLDEVSSYKFCEIILDICKSHNVKEIITIGGVGLQEIPKSPKVYCTANSKNIIDRYKDGNKLETRLFGKIGPIMGVSGLLLGMAKKRDIEGIGFLAETYGHPFYSGVNGAKKVLVILNKRFGLNIDLNKLSAEESDIEHILMKKAEQMIKASRSDKLNKDNPNADYIG
ncbi:MAG: PAC2 family protein [Candidatus Woesearchaeota archaeon]